jgi:hypothetical protein
MAEPYVIAYVTLEEAPTMMTNIVDCDPKNLLSASRSNWSSVLRRMANRRYPCFGRYNNEH